jgi:hypothetical protein
VAIKITVSDIAGFKVDGVINDAAGNPQAFDFSLTATRLSGDDVDAKLNGDYTAPAIMAFMLEVNKGWSGVRDADDKPLPYSEDAFRELCKIPGVLFLAYKCYREQTGARAKN